MQMAIQIILPVVLLSAIRLEYKVHLRLVTNSNNSYPNQIQNNYIRNASNKIGSI